MQLLIQSSQQDPEDSRRQARPEEAMDFFDPSGQDGPASRSDGSGYLPTL
jgi:hypothetical protein